MKRIAFNGRLLSLAGGGLVLSGLASAQSTLYTKVGDGTNDRLGASVGNAGDYNDDGFTDFIGGAPEDFDVFSPAAGYARVYSGLTGNPIQTMPGLQIWDGFGGAVDGAGDVNMDGTDDVIVGAKSAGASQRGQATIFSGDTGLELYTFTGDEDLDFLGHSVSRAGDVNLDGYDDTLVGMPGHDEIVDNVGEARVYSGFDGTILWAFRGTGSGDQVGISVSELGDTNSDGRADVLIGSLAGGVKVYSGIDGDDLLEFFGASSDTYGRSVSSIPDVTGDGRPDILIGATQESVLAPGPGYVQCRNGVTGALLWTIDGDSDGDRFGIALSGSPDWDGDGVPDAVVGADPTNASLENYVRILSGVDGATLFGLQGDNPQDNFGGAVAGLGDINGDSRNDIAIGASTGSPNGTASGYIRVYSGAIVSTCGDITPYCTVSPNSAGPGAVMLNGGTVNVGDNDLVLLSTGCPPNQNGIFYYGAAQNSVPFGNGVRCIGGTVFRLPITATSATGLASWPLNLNAAPANSGPGQITPGSTWNFQFWFRDPPGGGEQFNLSNGLEITFCP